MQTMSSDASWCVVAQFEGEDFVEEFPQKLCARAYRTGLVLINYFTLSKAFFVLNRLCWRHPKHESFVRVNTVACNQLSRAINIKGYIYKIMCFYV